MTKYIGITGGIASGKSAVGDYLASLGYPVIDADLIAREVVEPGRETLAALREAFGPGLLSPAGDLDRRALAAVIFKDDQKRAQLNQIMHPAIDRAMQKKMAAAQDQPLVFLMVPLLYETGFQKHCDEVWLVRVSRETQVRRLMARDDIDAGYADHKIKAQMTDEDRLAYGPQVINNDGDLDALHAQVDELLREVG
ncbi:dephospho-CoA kinase [Peptococcus simiae]|uniref:dephospho-CoA kinase n=1 Tax=Peptococcus simiae TaxID=1643805 RepID=UPI00397E975F